MGVFIRQQFYVSPSQFLVEVLSSQIEELHKKQWLVHLYRRTRRDRYYARYTTKFFEVLGEFLPPISFPCVYSKFRIYGLTFCSVNRSLLLRVLT